MKSKTCIWKNNKQCFECFNEVGVVIKYLHHLHSGQLLAPLLEAAARYVFVQHNPE